MFTQRFMSAMVVAGAAVAVAFGAGGVQAQPPAPPGLA